MTPSPVQGNSDVDARRAANARPQARHEEPSDDAGGTGHLGRTADDADLDGPLAVGHGRERHCPRDRRSPTGGDQDDGPPAVDFDADAMRSAHGGFCTDVPGGFW